RLALAPDLEPHRWGSPMRFQCRFAKNLTALGVKKAFGGLRRGLSASGRIIWALERRFVLTLAGELTFVNILAARPTLRGPCAGKAAAAKAVENEGTRTGIQGRQLALVEEPGNKCAARDR